MSTIVVSFQICSNSNKTHFFPNIVCVWGTMVHKYMYGANIRTIDAAVLKDNCACLCPAVLLALNTKTKCPFQGQWSGGGGVQPSSPKRQTKVCPCCCGTEYAILQAAGWCCCHAMCSFTIVAQTEETFVNHYEGTDKTVLRVQIGTGLKANCLLTVFSLTCTFPPSFETGISGILSCSFYN